MARMKKLWETLTGDKVKTPEKPKRDHDTIQYSDQTKCRHCGKVWDTNDYDPPECD